MADEIRTKSVQVVAGPKGISIDSSGRIGFRNPEVLQAIITAAGDGELATEAGENYVQCSCNNYQCGKAIKSAIADMSAPERAKSS